MAPRAAAFQTPTSPWYPGYPDINHIQGDAETHFKLFAVNAGVQLPGDVELYGNGTYGIKDSQSYENYRVPNKVVYDPATAAASARGGWTRAAKRRHEHSHLPFPLGFNPLEESKENDFQLVAGLKGEIVGWTWDLAEAYGEDHMDVYTINSANASLYADTGSTPTNFYDGKFISTQSTSTIDIAKDFDLGMPGPLTVAFGGEHRRETWVLGTGRSELLYRRRRAVLSGLPSDRLQPMPHAIATPAISTWPRRPSRG